MHDHHALTEAGRIPIPFPEMESVDPAPLA